jgi:hypothetical protein
MMNKSGAGWLRFGAMRCLLVIGGLGWVAGTVAQTPAPLPQIFQPESPVAEKESVEIPSAPEPVPQETPPRLPPEQRLENLKTADAATLQAAADDCLKAAEDYTRQIPALHQQARETYEQLRQSDPEILDLQRQVTDLQSRIVKALENHPAVLEKQQAIDRAQQSMLAELKLRTTLEGLLSQRQGVEPVPAPDAPPAE